MKQTHTPSAALTLSNYRTYLFATLFTLGNIALPQLCHLLPSGGMMWQPIYFFTLIATCLMGWRVGLLTALVSPLANTLWFAMPSAAMLPVVLTKSVALALLIGLLAHRKSTLWLLPSILTAQLIGALAEWALLGQGTLALNHLILGIPGIALQIIAGLLLLKKDTK